MSSSFFRRTALSAALATGAATMVAVPASVADEPRTQDPGRTRSVDLTGTLLVLAGENGDPSSYSVRRPNGQIVPIDPGSLDAFDGVDGNSRFAGTVRLPVVNGRATSLRAAAGNGTALAVTEARVNPRPTAAGPVVHRVAVALTSNLGTYTLTPDQILGQIKIASDYWIDQADGKITGYELPASTAFVPYNTTTTTVATGCGIAGDQDSAPEFDAVTNEAAALFPGYDFFNGTDQLVVVMPDPCAQMFAGRGSLGDSLASGGVSIVSAGPVMSKTQAHEWGHNYGLEHANTAVEYGDIYEVMGSAYQNVPPELGTGYRHEQGLLQAGEVASLTATSGAATIRDRATTAESGVRGVEVIDPDNGARLWFDLRTGTGSDAGAAYRNGITVYGQTYRAQGVVVEQDLGRGLRLQTPGGASALIAGEAWSNASGTMKVTVSALDAAAGTSTLSSAYAPGPAVTGGTASISGGTRPFERAQATGTGFSPSANGLRYQWFANGAPIPNEEEATLDIPLSLVGASLTVQITGYAAGRSPSAPVMSAPAKVAPATFYVVRGTANRLAISGKARTGQVLSTTGLAWIGDDGRAPVGLASTFQWYRGSKAIKGATGASYQLKAADLGDRIYVRNLASAPGFDQGRASSDDTSRVKKGKLPSAKPRIKFKGNKAKAGKRLKVKTGTWLSKVKFRFQWYAGGRKIRGANGKVFVPGRGLRKKKVTVKVTGSKRGYKSAARKSGAVKIK